MHNTDTKQKGSSHLDLGPIPRYLINVQIFQNLKCFWSKAFQVWDAQSASLYNVQNIKSNQSFWLRHSMLLYFQ